MIRPLTIACALSIPLLAAQAAAQPDLEDHSRAARMASQIAKGPMAYVQDNEKTLELWIDVDELKDGAWRDFATMTLLDPPGDPLYLEVDVTGQGGGFLHRTATDTRLYVAHKGVEFHGSGEVSAENTVDLRAMLADSLGLNAKTAMGLRVLMGATPETLGSILMSVAPVQGDFSETDEGVRLDSDDYIVTLRPDGTAVIELEEVRFSLRTVAQSVPRTIPPYTPPPDVRVETVDRDIMERTIRRGLVRAMGIKLTEWEYEPPEDGVTEVENGTLVVRGGQRLVFLHGTHAEVGRAHGELLPGEIRKLVDSTMYTVGLVYSVGSGKWFPSEIREAWGRLEPHVPPEYMDEIAGMAETSGVGYEELKLTQFFPELFHCSGFAIKGAATVDGKLYHGRVLDYMTDIGLQYSATVTITAVEGKHAWLNVGYAGFTGSVTGMNDQMISIGEMGGRGEGQWDGVPMSHLVRMALEQADSLDDVKAIFRDNPRTCEYYYIFADGETRDAVGVYAVPEKIEFVGFGEAHEKLPRPIEDTVLLSAGGRYERLCERVEADYADIDVEGALRLMDVGVAMKNANLHNALFIPEDLVVHVANAGAGTPAAENPYYEYDMRALMAEYMPGVEQVAAGE